MRSTHGHSAGSGASTGHGPKPREIEPSEHLVALGTDTPLDAVAALTADLVDADVAMVSVIGSTYEIVLGTVGAIGFRSNDDIPVSFEKTLCTVVRDEGLTVTIDDVADDPRFGGTREVSVRACAGAPITTEDGEIIGAVCAGSTSPRHWRSSDRHALESMARFAERELVRAVDTIERLDRAQELALVVGRLRHELSGDLTVVLGGIETALHPSASDEIRVRALTNARSDAMRVIDVLDALLRTDARTSVRARVTPLRSIVDDAIRPMDELTRQRLTIDCADVRVEVAGRLLTRVVANLADNALKHTPGDVHITGATDGGSVELSVADAGPGFRPEALEQLFEPFSAAHDPADDQGFGLGLFIVRELVERLDGDIDVESTDTGSTVTIIVPAATVGATPAPGGD